MGAEKEWTGEREVEREKEKRESRDNAHRAPGYIPIWTKCGAFFFLTSSRFILFAFVLFFSWLIPLREFWLNVTRERSL